MPDVRLSIGGRHYDVRCQEGEEDHLRNLAEVVDAKAAEARAATGGINEVRQLLFAALLLADDLTQKPAAKASNADPEAFRMTASLTNLAARIERLADKVASP